MTDLRIIALRPTREQHISITQLIARRYPGVPLSTAILSWLLSEARIEKEGEK